MDTRFWGKVVLKGNIQQGLEVLCCVGWTGNGSDKVTLAPRPEGDKGGRCGDIPGAQQFRGRAEQVGVLTLDAL